MIFLACSCGLLLRITGDSQEGGHLLGAHSSWYPAAYPCPSCEKNMRYAEAVPAADLVGLQVVDLSVVEAYSALMGAGLPDERDCGELAVRMLLLENKVTQVDVCQVRGANRSIVRSLTFADGRRLYLGSGPDGAVAYRIASRRVPHA